MKEIQLSRGGIALVDDEDFERVNQLRWMFMTNGYAARSKKKPKSRSSFAIYMHRFIMNAEKGTVIDHIDHNKLNNQKSNLRIVTHSQNSINCTKRLNTTSKYFGVCYYHYRGNKKWYSYITHQNKRHFVGWFATENEAALAYNAAADKIHGELAKKNIIV